MNPTLTLLIFLCFPVFYGVFFDTNITFLPFGQIPIFFSFNVLMSMALDDDDTYYYYYYFITIIVIVFIVTKLL